MTTDDLTAAALRNAPGIFDVDQSFSFSSSNFSLGLMR